MTQYLRYLIFFILSIFMMAAYAVDHVTCTILPAEEGPRIPSDVKVGETYHNIYVCTSTYPASFPAIQLVGTVLGNAAGTSVEGSCATTKLAPGHSCQFQLNFTPTKGTQTFHLRVSVGTLYYIDIPDVTATVNPPPSTGITWPGSNSGFAQADSTENGFGSFTADATDSSGHDVIYTFEIISGPGTITGSQTGSFSLTGVNGTTVIRITATADDATPVVGTPFTVTVSDIPTKVLYFYNNTSETIYPVIEAPILNVDTWLQGQFAITDVATYTFQATKLHRAYVNGTNGIPPHQSALVSVPFYSYLTPAPTGGNQPDQYVDWWSSMRVYLYDVQSYLIQTQSESGVSPVTLYAPAPGPICISGCSEVTVYSAPVIMPTNDPQQLTEYTFAAVTTNTIPYPIDRTIVNYDYSAVDQVYLPAAMEPYGTNLIGYTGTTVDLTSFRNSMNSFLADTQWPVYAGLPYPRIPGAYNVVIGNSQLTNTVPQTNTLTAYWNNCSTNPSNADYANCTAVFNMFDANYAACNGGAHLSGPTALPMSNLYGYVSFCGIALPSSAADPGFQAYTALQYNYKNYGSYAQDFNPYTSLIHQALQMNVYAYSVDDAVGFIRAIGNGLVITVGGELGLPNGEQYNKQSVITVSPGTPPAGPAPIFTHYGICSQTASSGQIGRGESFEFQLPSSSYPCVITLQDSNNQLYHFTLNNPAPLTAASVSCSAADNPWCSTTVVVTSTKSVSTGAPTS